MHINNNLQQHIDYKRTEKLMGNRFEITVVAADEQFANKKIDLAIIEIKRIEKLLSTFEEDSQTNQINKQAGIEAVKVDKEVFELIERSIKISTITDGAFDISYGSIDKRFWNFDKTMTSLPDAATAKLSVQKIDYRNIILNKEKLTVFLKEKGMRIGFGGIGKGYAAEMAKSMLKKEGVVSGIVNASGDLTTWGYQANNKPWTIGIANPNCIDLPFSYMNVTDMAVATS